MNSAGVDIATLPVHSMNAEECLSVTLRSTVNCTARLTCTETAKVNDYNRYTRISAIYDRFLLIYRLYFFS